MRQALDPENGEIGDYGSIVAQGITTYDLSSQSGYSNPAVSAGCDIKIEEIAPGSNVYALAVDFAGDQGERV